MIIVLKLCHNLTDKKDIESMLLKKISFVSILNVRFVMQKHPKIIIMITINYLHIIVMIFALGNYTTLFSKTHIKYPGDSPSGPILIYPQHLITYIEAPLDVLNSMMIELAELEAKKYTHSLTLSLEFLSYYNQYSFSVCFLVFLYQSLSLCIIICTPFCYSI